MSTWMSDGENGTIRRLSLAPLENRRFFLFRQQSTACGNFRPMPDTITVRVKALAPDVSAFVIEKETAPSWVQIKVETQGSRNAVETELVLPLVIAFQLVTPTLGEITKEAFMELAKQWLIDFITKLKAKRIRVDDREPKDESELKRIVAEQIAIGKND